MDRKLIFLSAFFAAATSGGVEPMMVSVKIGTHTMKPADSGRPSISDDGMVVAFESSARLMAEDRDNERDIYVFDIPSGQLRRIDTPDPKRKNGGPFVSGDGKRLSFHSYSPNDPKLEQPQSSDIYLMSLSTYPSAPPPSRPVSDALGKIPDGELIYPRLDRYGGRLLFTSNSVQLSPAAKVGFSQIYIYEEANRAVSLISRSPKGATANRQCGHPRLSANGLRGAFLSVATNFEPELPVTNLSQHLYWFDRSSGTVIRVDTFETGFNPDEWTPGAFDMDDSGRLLVFEARKRDTEPSKALSIVNLFLYDQEANRTMLLTTELFSNRSRNPSVSGNGRFVAFVLSGGGGIVIHDRETDRWKRVVEGECENPVFSKDGRTVAYERRDKSSKKVYVIRNVVDEP